jgi:hypothetical protein
MGAGAALGLDVEFMDLGSVMGRSSGPDAASNATQEHSRARVSFILGFGPLVIQRLEQVGQRYFNGGIFGAQHPVFGFVEATFP